EGELVSRKLESGADDWLADNIEKVCRDPVGRHANADGTLLRILQPAGRLVGRLQDEGIGPWRQRPDQAVSSIVHLGVVRDLRQIPADQTEFVTLVDSSEGPD